VGVAVGAAVGVGVAVGVVVGFAVGAVVGFAVGAGGELGEPPPLHPAMSASEAVQVRYRMMLRSTSIS
jgi:hypothetical protein